MLGRYIIRFIDERTVKRKTKRNRAKARLTKTRTVLRRFLTMFLYSNGRYFMGNLQEIIMLAGNRFMYQVIQNICNYYPRINGIPPPIKGEEIF
jgi:hypothetical protein